MSLLVQATNIQFAVLFPKTPCHEKSGNISNKRDSTTRIKLTDRQET